MTTVRQALLAGTQRLAELETPFLDAALLLAHTLGISKEKLLASYPDELPLSAVNEYHNYLSKRLAGYPVSYIRRKKEFFGLPFYVDERVLVPRPDTETLVEITIEDIDDRLKGIVPATTADATESFAVDEHQVEVSQIDEPLKVLDIGTGSGCIAITLQHLRPHIEAHAADISQAALAVCNLNSRHLLSAPLRLIESDLFSAIDDQYHLIVSNPPYLTQHEVEEMRSRHWPEPTAALDGGVDGLDTIRILINEGYKYLNPGGALYLEAGIAQITTIEALFAEHGYEQVRAYPDLSGRNRVVGGKKPYAESN